MYHALMSSKEVIKKLKNAGWTQTRKRGSHAVFEHSTNPTIVVVPHPKRDLAIGTLKSIEKASGVKLT